MQGIYEIRNIINNKIYIGSANNIKKRFTRHKRQLKKGIHHNVYLQRSYDKYGKENFTYNIIEETEELPQHDLFALEQLYIDNTPNKYNIGSVSGGDNLTNHPNREEIIKKISEASKKRYENMSDEEFKAFCDNFRGEKNPNWRGGGIKNNCDICGVKLTSYYSTNCINCYDKSGDNNPFYGKHHTDETKAHLSKIKRGEYHGNQEKRVSIDGVEYKSMAEAHRQLNINISTISWRCKSKNKKFKDYFIIKN